MSKMSTLISKYSRIALLLLLCVPMAVFSSNFLQINNLLNILRQSSMLLILSFGMMFAMLLGRGVDMSIGATLALTSCLAAEYMQRDVNDPMHLVVGMLIVVILSVIIGIINGALVAYLRLPAILVTLGTREMIRGVAYYLMSDKVITQFPSFVTFVGTGKLFGIPMPVIIALLFLVITIILLRYTTVGRKLYLVGANPVTARFSGISSNAIIIFGFIMSSVFAGLAGIVYIGRLNAAEPQIGADFAFQAVSAVAIGGTSFNGGIGTAMGTVVGAIILTLLINAMNLLNISAYWQGTVNGIVVILSVLLDYFARRKTR